MSQDVAPDRKRYSVCGDAKQADMDHALHRIVANPGGMDEASARTDIQELAQELAETGRDRKDVY